MLNDPVNQHSAICNSSISNMRFAPLHRRGDERLGRRAGVRTAAAGEATDRADLHVVIADDLTREPDTDGTFGGQNLALGNGHSRGLSVDEFDSARRAPRIAAARVQDVDFCILLDRQHQAFAILDIKCSEIFNRQLGHVALSF